MRVFRDDAPCLATIVGWLARVATGSSQKIDVHFQVKIQLAYSTVLRVVALYFSLFFLTGQKTKGDHDLSSVWPPAGPRVPRRSKSNNINITSCRMSLLLRLPPMVPLPPPGN